MAEAKRKRGRPSKKDTLDLEKVRKIASKGWTDEEMADFFDVEVRTWYRWKAEDEAFCQALKDWKAEADERVERALYERALGYSHPEEKIFYQDGQITRAETVKHYPPDTTAAIFWLKNRRPADWRDKRELDVREIDDMTEEEVDEALAELEDLQAGDDDRGEAAEAGASEAEGEGEG